MSTGNLKSIDKLRNIAYGYAPNIRRQVNMACDEINSEIAERFMELPLDADGVPIHIGDELFNKNKPTDVYKVTAIADNGYLRIYHDTAHIHSSQCRHVKPRTIEDVLYECFHDCMYKYPTGIEDIIGKYADELRSMWMIGEPGNELMNSEVVGE